MLSERTPCMPARTTKVTSAFMHCHIFSHPVRCVLTLYVIDVIEYMGHVRTLYVIDVIEYMGYVRTLYVIDVIECMVYVPTL